MPSFVDAMTLSSLLLAALLEVAPPAAAIPPKSGPSEPSTPGAAAAAPKTSHTVFQVATNAIALTFNDGPHAKNTPRLLDILKERGVKATFFLIGQNVAANPQIVKRMTDEGHEVGNATWSHKGLKNLDEARLTEELQKAHDAILAASGAAPRIYRPPFGSINARQQAIVTKHFGYPAILWEVDTRDWQAPRTAAKVHDRILKETHAGSIILCHDAQPATVDAMPATLDELKAKGFQFLTISELIKLEADSAGKKAAPPPQNKP
jgi:peptidoglycan/xylan/chitin deacetylase (PgdA/CDA1 family)